MMDLSYKWQVILVTEQNLEKMLICFLIVTLEHYYHTIIPLLPAIILHAPTILA